jgi:hypothetical protein
MTLIALICSLFKPARPAAKAAAGRPVVEFHADAGGAQGALFVNGQFFGHLAGVSRL